MCVCVCQARGAYGCPSGNRPRVFNTEEMEGRTLSAWRTQHSKRRGQWSSYTHGVFILTYTQTQSAMHIVTVSPSLSYTNTRTVFRSLVYCVYVDIRT